MAHRETRTPLRLLLLSTVLLLLVLLSVEVQAQRVTIRFSSSSFSFEEEGGQHCFTLSATGLKDLLCTADVSVTVGLRNITFTATPFDALQGGGDFLLDGVFVSNNPKTVTFGPSDEISSDFCFLIVGDNAYEGDESFFVEILDVTGPACADELAVMDPPFVEIQIVDNDELLVNFTERRIIVNEGEDAVLSARSYVNPFSQALSIGIICFEPSSGNRLTPATLDVDYRLTEDTLRFTGVDEQPPVLSDTIVIRTIDDDFAEETESFICALRLTVNPTDPLQSTDPDTVTISIRDNDMLSISWLEPAYRFPEAGTIALVSLVASNRFTVNFTVSGQPEEVDTSQDFYVCNGTEYPLAKRNEDFLPAGSVAFEFSTVIRNRVSMNTFRLLDNDILEDDEVFVGNFQIPSIIGQQLKIEKKAPTVTCIVIEDDDYVQVNFTDTTIEVSESAGTVNVSFDLSGLHAIPLNVTVLCEEAAPASAMDGPDFLAASRVFSFPANSDVSPTLAGPLSISIINNEVLEAQESFVCRFVDPSHPRIILGPPVTITIVDEDSVTVRYNQSLYEVAEEDGSVSLRLVLEGDSDIPVCVQTSSFELDESSSRPRATATEDFAMETRSFTFQPGVKGWDFVVGLEDDVIPEGEEFFYGNVTLCDPEDADMVLIGEPSQPLVRITDADKFVSISLTSSSYSVIESGNAVEVCVSLNDTYGVDIAVSLQLSSSGDNAATAGVDLEMGPFDVTVAANTLQSCVNISITDDLVVEGNEVATVSLTYTDNQAGVSVGTPDMATVTIFDDDAIMWYFTNETYTVGEDDQTLLVTIRANGTASFPYNISVGVEDILTTFGADYSLVSFSTATATPSIANTLPHTITPGTDEVILTFMISDDEVFEGDEDFRVTLMVDMATVADGISAGTPDVATVTIADGDAMSCFFQPSAYNNSEGNTVDLMVACNRQFERSFNLTINTRDLAIDVSTRAVGGVDYEAFSGRVTLDANTQSGVVSVPLLHDDDYECNEQFEAFLQRSVDAPQGISVTDPATATVDIQDSTEVCVLVNSTDYTVIEGNVVTVGLRVDKKLSCPVHAVVTLMDGSAVAPEDYIHRQFNVTFNPGSLTAEVSIQTRPDNVGELDETFTLMIAPADGSERVSSCDPDQSTVTIIENTDCEVRFNPDEYGVNEGSVASLKLELSCEIAPGVECEVTVVTGNDTAHSPVDFQGGLYTVVFSGSNMATLNITTLVDSVTEGPERFRANILIPFSSAPKLTAGSPDQAIVDIHDSSMLEVFFSQSAYCVNESDPVGVVTVIASGVHQLNYTVNVGIRGLTATVFEDYSSLSVELKFQPGEVEKTFEIPIIDDMVIEDVEEVLLTIFVTKASLGVGVLPGEPSMARLQIVDDDCVTVQFAEVSQFVLEGVTAAIPLTAEYSGILNSTFNVTVRLSDGTATAPSDYGNDSPVYTAVFQPDSMVSTILVDVVEDNLAECIEDFTAFLMSSTRGKGVCVLIGQPDMTTVNILDGNDPIEVVIDPVTYSADEGEKVNITLRTNSSLYSFPFSVSLMFVDISATQGSDYFAQPTTVSFSPGEEQVSFEVTTVDDDIAELTEMFEIVLLNVTSSCGASPVVIGSEDTAQVEIVDRDVVKVFFDPDSYTVVEGSNALLIIKTDRDFSSPFEVAVMTMPGTATEGMDYEGGIYTATFQPGSQTANVSIPTLSDAILEPNEVFEGLLMVSSTTGDLKVEVSSPDVSNITITDSTTLTVRFDPAEYTVTEGGIANLTLVADKVFDVPFNVTVTLMGITATGGVDYKDSSPYTVSFKPGSMVAVLQVPILNDGIVETTETFDATISIPDSSRALGIQPGDPSVANVNIVDGDGVVTVTIDPTSLNVTEGERAKLTLIADKNFSFNFTVFLDTADIEAIDGEDYVGGEIAVVFTPGSLMVMVFIDTTDDQISELTETFSATIRVPDDEDLVAAGDPSSSVVTILDNDGVCVYVEPTDYSLLEGTVANFTLRMNTTQYLFDCAVTLRSVDGSAIAGDDYQGGPYTVMFSQGQEMASVSIATFHDSSAEGNEIFFVQLDKSCGDHVTFCSDDQGRVVIVDDDSLNVFFQPDSYEVVEGGVATITIATSSQDYDFEFTVVLRYRNGTAQEFFDFFPETTSVTFSPGQSNATFEVPTPEDALSELTEEYYVDIVSVSMPDLVGISDPSTATVSILDNEEAIEVIFDPIAYSVDEGGKVNVTLRTSSNFYSFPFSVSLMFMDISATQGSDYVAQPTTVSFSPGEGQVSFEVTTVDDDVAELTEMFKIVIVNTNQSQLVVPGSADVATVEIADDDEPVELTISSMNVTESTGFVVVCVDKDRPSANPITLDIDPQQLVAGSSPDQGGDLLMAQGGVDFDSSTVSITIPANSTHECVNITITDDSLVECDEIFNVSMAIDSNVDQFAAAEFSLVVSETLITIIDDDTITVMFEEPMYMVTEGEGPLMVRLVSTGNTSFDFNIDVNLEPPVRMGRNALPGEDFVKNESLAFFVAGGDSGEITIFVLEDEIFESNETFSMSLSVPEEFQSKRIFVGALNVTVVLIKDNDVATVVFNPIMYNTPEGSKVEVCLEVDRDIEQPFTAVVNSKNGTAIGKLDYDEGVFFAEFMPGSRTSCFFVVTMNDSIVEVPEDFQLIITTVGPDNVGVVIGQDDVATVIIIDTTVEVPVRFEFDRYNVTEAEEEVSVALVTDIDHQFDFTVTVIVRDGTAERPADFTSADEIQVVFPAGVNRVELPISVINDNLAEPTEDFHLDLVVPEEAGLAGVISIAPNTTTVDVLDDDVVELTFELPDYIIKENEGPLIVRINASGPSAIPYTITITPQPNTAQADSDFDPTPITVTINPGETSASVTIPITDDSVVEVTEQFRLVMTVEDDMGDMKVVPGQPSTVTVQDNDVLVSFSQPEYRVTTKDLFAMIGINASGDLSQAFTVTGILEDGTAIEGVDYEGKTFEVKFGPGVTMQTFNVRIRSGKNRTEDIFFFGNITEVDRDRVSIGEPSRTKIFILDLSGSSSQEGAINDSVIGDPLFTIPLPTTVSTDEFLKEQVSLCFEFHGSANKQYSLISDQCTFANAHYAPASADPTLHIISEIGIRTEGANLSCHDVHVQMEGCQVTLDGRPFSGRYQANGITLNTMRNRVRISTDNCITGRSLVMWVVCDQLTEIHHLRFIVSRGSSIRPIGHGLIGQFWNIPVDLVPYHGPYGNFNTVPNDIQAYNLTFKPVGKPPRSVIAELAEKTWDNTKTPCLYAGDGMGGPIFEAPPEFGSVIEDVPDSYEVASLFEHNFKFSKFVVKC